MPSVMSMDWNLNLFIFFFFCVHTLAKEEFLSDFVFRFNGSKFSILFTIKYRLHKMI